MMANVTRTTRKRGLPLVKEAVLATTRKPETISPAKKITKQKQKKEAATNVKSTPWVTMTLPRTELDLSTTLKCGQSFRWHREHLELESGEISGPTFSCVLNNQMWRIQETDDGFRYRTFRPVPSHSSTHGKEESENVQNEYMEQDKEFLRDYFQLDVPLTKLYDKWSKVDANFKAKASFFPGVRILRQDPVENLICFICSSNNNIGRISQMATKLCQEYGAPIIIPAELPDESPMTYYGFPTIGDLAQDGVEENLRNLGFGYRAKYIATTAKMINDMDNGEEWLLSLRKLPYEEAHAALLTLQGVGPKVADCVCLMSLDKHETIPVDTHVWQIAVRDYKFRFEGKVPKTISPAIYKAVGKHFVDLFGKYSGWAHSVLFAADLRTIEGRVKEEPGSILMIKEEVDDDNTTILAKAVKVEVLKTEEQETISISKSIDEIKLESSSSQPEVSTGRRQSKRRKEN